MIFQEHLRQAATEAVTSIPASEAHDAYVLAFLVYDEEDDPRRPTLTIGYNTQTRVQEILAAQPGSELLPAGAPTDPAEARWNYAYWLQNELAMIGDSTRDPVGAQLRDQWIKDSGLWYDEPEAAPVDAPDAWDAVKPRADQITQRFVQACVQLANQLHADGLIQKIFGRPVPVLVHEVEYYDAIADQAEAANPPGVAADFVTWVRNPLGIQSVVITDSTRGRPPRAGDPPLPSPPGPPPRDPAQPENREPTSQKWDGFQQRFRRHRRSVRSHLGTEKAAAFWASAQVGSRSRPARSSASVGSG